MSGPKKVRENRKEGANFDMLEPEEGIPEVYLDGIASTSLSVGMSKIDFYTVTGFVEKDGAQIEQRLSRYRVVMPAAAWIEFCANFTASMRSQKEEVLQGIDEAKARIENALGEAKKTDEDEGA